MSGTWAALRRVTVTPVVTTNRPHPHLKPPYPTAFRSHHRINGTTLLSLRTIGLIRVSVTVWAPSECLLNHRDEQSL